MKLGQGEHSLILWVEKQQQFQEYLQSVFLEKRSEGEKLIGWRMAVGLVRKPFPTVSVPKLHMKRVPRNPT
jgi:hypothetical protein